MENVANFTLPIREPNEWVDTDYGKLIGSFYKTLDLITAGVVLVNNEGCALFVNEAAKSIFNKKSSLKLSSNGLISGECNKVTITVKKLIKDAISKPSKEMTHISLNGLLSTNALTLGALHLQTSTDQSLPCVALYIVDQESYEVVPSQVLSDLYGLTKREAELAVALARGERVSEFAKQRSVSLNTVNTQLKSIMGKTSTSRQSDLIRLIVTSFPFIPRAAIALN